MELIDIKKRNQYRCHLCGSSPVKYFMEVYDPIVDTYKKTKVAYCNKCALFFKEKESK